MQTDGQFDRWKQTYMTMLFVAFTNFANAPKNGAVLKVTSVSLCTN